MKPLPLRVTEAFAAVDADWMRLYEMSDLKGVREHHLGLTRLLADFPDMMKAARNAELSSHAIRRWDQATKLLNHKATGMTVKEAEEESRLDVKKQFLKEIDDDANMVGLETLMRALLEKIRFTEAIANDIKHFSKHQ
jgi:hypothetical protein